MHEYLFYNYYRLEVERREFHRDLSVTNTPAYNYAVTHAGQKDTMNYSYIELVIDNLVVSIVCR
jgi:hypothetical protein